MKTYRFGIDIDGTITDPSSFIPYINRHFNKSLTLEDIQEYDLSVALGISGQEFDRWMQHHEPRVYEQSKPAAGALETLKQWRQNHELYFISARPPAVKDVTYQWFNNHGVPFDHIELLGQHNKLHAAKSLEVDMFFEDKHDNAVMISEDCNIPVILMDTPYNRLAVPQNVHRVSSWNEARAVVERILQAPSLK
ncbi:5' nucleotidase, NT5C type [Salisediminibacterium halotolerans]|uniref:Nucleotidase n=1 Tax=Salisediminibacterium halotolerans TaxID=517425 RepID=A0A1H9S907_9BACI|nr:hypothetical protein [Salisediminibacterium haloalkalitolerans]SER81487.1 hypothetical protein SAMN05444126_10698 [Salisediminibacterium haloalkalitolerans]